MAKYKAKTVPHDGEVEAFISGLADAGQQADSRALVETLGRISGEKATMWGPSIIGFGRFHYRYASGHEGDIFRVGFSPRKGKFSLYMWPPHSDMAAMLARLGKHTRAKSCLYVRRLADIDMAVLEEMARACVEADPQALISQFQSGH